MSIFDINFVVESSREIEGGAQDRTAFFAGDSGTGLVFGVFSTTGYEDLIEDNT